MRVSRELAKLAKEKGFDRLCLTYIAEEDCPVGLDPFKKGDLIMSYPAECPVGEERYTKVLEEQAHWTSKPALSIPTQSQLQDWLWEIYQIHIEIWLDYGPSFGYSIKTKHKTETWQPLILFESDIPFDMTPVPSETLELALFKALTLLP